MQKHNDKYLFKPVTLCLLNMNFALSSNSLSGKTVRKSRDFEKDTLYLASTNEGLVSYLIFLVQINVKAHRSFL